MVTGSEALAGGILGYLGTKLFKPKSRAQRIDAPGGQQMPVVYEMRGGVVGALMTYQAMGANGPVSLRAHDVHPGMATNVAPPSTQPSPSSGGLGGQAGVGVMGPASPTVPAASAPQKWVEQQEYNQQQQAHAQTAQLFDTESFPMFWRDQRYSAFQDSDREIQEDTGILATEALNSGAPPTRIARLNKTYISAWEGIQQWGYTQTNQRLNMRPVGPWRDKTRGTRSVSGVKDVLVQGSGNMRIPAVFVPPSVY